MPAHPFLTKEKGSNILIKSLHSTSSFRPYEVIFKYFAAPPVTVNMGRWSLIGSVTLLYMAGAGSR